MKLSFVVCSNGFGHFKRVLLTCEEVLRIESEAHISIFCSEQQFSTYKIRKELDNLLKSQRVDFNTEFMNSSPLFWPPERFKFNQYKDFIQNVWENEVLRNSDLVISDNILGVMELSNEVILMGSFLWHDVLAEYSNQFPDCSLLYNHDIRLLAELRTPMICNKYMVMPVIESNMETVKCSWFCNTKEINKDRNKILEKKNVLLTFGANLLLDIEKEKIFNLINNNNEVNFYIDQKLNGFASANTTKFDFTDEEFDQLNVIICRPGVGILTDAVKNKVPVILLKESNKEITHNAEKYNNLGCGIVSKGYEHLIDEINHVTDPQIKSVIFENLNKMELNGHTQAALFLVNKIKNG